MKKSELIITLSLVVIAIIVVTVFAFVTKGKKEEEKSIISNISINGIKLGIEMEKSRQHLVMDYDYKFEDDDVYFKLDDNNKVIALEFLTTETGGTIKGIADVEILHKDTRLKTIDDFKKLLGEGKETKEDNRTIIEYSDDEATLTITNYKDKYINVEIIAK